MANQEAKQDPNQFPALILHTGTAGTAETVRATGQALGAQNVHITGGTVIAGTLVSIASGTQQILDTVGTIGVVNAGSVVVTNGTITSLGGTSTVEQQFSYNHQSASGTTTIKNSAGFLHTDVINQKSVGGLATFYDSASGTNATVIAAIDTTLSTTAFVYDVRFTSGLVLGWAGNTGGDLTLSYR